MRDIYKFRRSPVAAAVFAALHAATSHAAPQEAKAQELPKISVQEQEDALKVDTLSSPKFTQPLLETPQTITVIPKALFLQQGATNLTEALRNSPGITLLAGEGGAAAGTAGDSIFMRGFDTQSNIFVDGIRDLGSISRDIFNTEQIEVAKGPSGADNGRASAAGYINLSSKLAQFGDSVSGSAGFGDEEHKRATLDVNQELGASTAVRFNAMWQDGGVAGRDFAQQDRWGIAPAIAFGLGTATRAHFFYQHVEQDNIPDYGIPTVGLEGYYNTATPGVTMAPVDRENFYGNAIDFEDIRVDMFTARVEHDLASGFTITNTSRYGKSSREAILTAPTNVAINTTDPSLSTATRTRQANVRENTLITNQTNARGEVKTGSINHVISGGVEAIYEKQFNPSYTGLGTVAAVPGDLYNPNPRGPVTGYAPVKSGAYTKGETTTLAGYISDTVEFNDRWEWNASVRLEHYDTEFVSVTATTVTPPATANTATTIETADNLVSWKTGVLFKPLDNGSVYLSYATSSLPPGGANFSLNTGSENANNVNVDPQEATNVELGTKWEFFDARLGFAAAVYRSENEDQVVELEAGSFAQFGKQRVDGIEVSAIGQITDNWSINGGIAYMDAETIEGTTPTPTSPGTTGQPIQWTPKVSATLWTTYELPFGLILGGGGRYVDSQPRSNSGFYTPEATNFVEVESWWVLDAVASYDFNDNITLQLNAYNLTDEEYVASLNNNGNRYTPGTARSFLATLNYRF